MSGICTLDYNCHSKLVLFSFITPPMSVEIIKSYAISISNWRFWCHVPSKVTKSYLSYCLSQHGHGIRMNNVINHNVINDFRIQYGIKTLWEMFGGSLRRL